MCGIDLSVGWEQRFGFLANSIWSRAFPGFNEHEREGAKHSSSEPSVSVSLIAHDSQLKPFPGISEKSIPCEANRDCIVTILAISRMAQYRKSSNIISDQSISREAIEQGKRMAMQDGLATPQFREQAENVYER